MSSKATATTIGNVSLVGRSKVANQVFSFLFSVTEVETEENELYSENTRCILY